MRIWRAFVIKFLLLEFIPAIFFTNFAAISDKMPVIHNKVAIIKSPWIIRYAENFDSPILIDKESAFKKFLIGSKKGKNSNEKKKKTNANKMNLARPESGFSKFFQKLVIFS